MKQNTIFVFKSGRKSETWYRVLRACEDGKLREERYTVETLPECLKKVLETNDLIRYKYGKFCKF